MTMFFQFPPVGGPFNFFRTPLDAPLFLSLSVFLVTEVLLESVPLGSMKPRPAIPLPPPSPPSSSGGAVWRSSGGLLPRTESSARFASPSNAPHSSVRTTIERGAVFRRPVVAINYEFGATQPQSGAFSERPPLPLASATLAQLPGPLFHFISPVGFILKA